MRQSEVKQPTRTVTMGQPKARLAPAFVLDLGEAGSRERYVIDQRTLSSTAENVKEL